MNFSIIGVAGYVAPKHLKAIKGTNNNVVAAFDPRDSVGIIDSFFPDANFFTEFEIYDRYIEKINSADSENKVEFVSICSPNYLHDAHIRFALRSGANAICEKPVVLNPHNILSLKKYEQEYGKRVYCILQLRLHPAIQLLKKEIKNRNKKSKIEVELTYITSRGKWYQYSWKGDIKKSGGVSTNIGVHLFDMLTYLFGKESQNIVHLNNEQKAAGYLEFDDARVKWFLSVDRNDLPEEISRQGKTTFRSLKMDGVEFEFSEGFTNLHTKVYEHILSGNGFGLDDTYAAIDIVSKIRQAKPLGKKGDYHNLVK